MMLTTGGDDGNVKRRNSSSSNNSAATSYAVGGPHDQADGKGAQARKSISGQPRLPNGRFQSTRGTSASGNGDSPAPGGNDMMEYQKQQQQRAWLDHHYRSMYSSSNGRSNSYSNNSGYSSNPNGNAYSNAAGSSYSNTAASSSNVKFVNATPDSLESQIKREEMGPKKKRMRTSSEQLRILNREFLTNPMPSSTARFQLAKRLDMSARAVQVWFQNRRAKAKLDARRSGQSSPKMMGSSTAGSGHRRAYSHNALYSYPSYAQLNQQLGGNNYSEGEDSMQANGQFQSDSEGGGIGGALDEYLGGSTGGLFLDPSEMILLSPPIDQQQKQHHRSVPGRAVSTSSAAAAYHPHHLQQQQQPTEDPIDHRQRLSPFEPVMLGEDFYYNRLNSLPMVSEYGGMPAQGEDVAEPPVMLQDPVMPPPPPLMYYCNAFSTSSGSGMGNAGGGNAAEAAFYYQPTPQPMLAAPFFNNPSSHAAGNSIATTQHAGKRSFSLPCIRPAEAYYHQGPRIPEDEELLLGLGTHILEENEYKSSRSHSISEQF